MHTTESIIVPAAASAVFAHIERLDAYPAWLPLVHSAVPVAADAGDSGPAWAVELRAKVGPFARSKRLRMERSELVDGESAVFTRRELDGREHAMWKLEARLDERDDATEVTMDLFYGGSLWTGGLLERVLDDQIREARAGLQRVLAG